MKSSITQRMYLANFSAMAFLFLMFACKDETFSPELTKTFTINSVVNGASYEIKVALPDHYDPLTKTYGTIYVLDGEENYELVANQCRQISNQHSTSNVLVVSIGYGNDRELDYTPTATSSSTGGAPKFKEFIKTELIPEMEMEFGSDTSRASRTILGHSYGGLFGTYVFAADNLLFGNYILLSPSIWFDNEVTLQMEKQNRSANSSRSQLVYLGQGELENSGRMQAPFEAFYQTLVKNYKALRISKHLEEDLDHVGSKNPNIRLGLNFYFENRSF